MVPERWIRDGVSLYVPLLISQELNFFGKMKKAKKNKEIKEIDRVWCTYLLILLKM